MTVVNSVAVPSRRAGACWLREVVAFRYRRSVDEDNRCETPILRMDAARPGAQRVVSRSFAGRYVGRLAAEDAKRRRQVTLGGLGVCA